MGQHLFEQCIMDLKQRGKCVILVTNALQFLKQSTQIVVLKDGRITEAGEYDELMKCGKGFREMIATMQDTSSSNAKNEDEGVEEEVLYEQEGADGDPKERSRTLSSVTGGEEKKRGNSIAVEEDVKVNLKKSTTLMAVEDRETGNVSIEVYGKWAVAAGGLSVGKNFDSLVK